MKRSGKRRIVDRCSRRPITHLESSPHDRALIAIYDEAHTDEGTSFDLSEKSPIKPEAIAECEDDGSGFVVPVSSYLDAGIYRTRRYRSASDIPVTR
jgi:hypothetical protein